MTSNKKPILCLVMQATLVRYIKFIAGLEGKYGLKNAIHESGSYNRWVSDLSTWSILLEAITSAKYNTHNFSVFQYVEQINWKHVYPKIER